MVFNRSIYFKKNEKILESPNFGGARMKDRTKNIIATEIFLFVISFLLISAFIYFGHVIYPIQDLTVKDFIDILPYSMGAAIVASFIILPIQFLKKKK